MRKISILLFAVALIAFSFSVGSYVLMKMPLRTQTFFASVHVSSGIGGFDINGTALTFGSVAFGGNSLRRVFIENNYPFSVLVEPVVTGSISPLVELQTPIVVEPNQSLYIPVLLNTNLAELNHNYTGNISFTFLRAGFKRS